MTAIEQKFMDAARAEIEAEDKAAMDRRVKERANRLKGEAQRIAAGAAPSTLAELQGELAALDARKPWSLSASEDARRDWLRQEIWARTRQVA
jgi:hypothetical protein